MPYIGRTPANAAITAEWNYRLKRYLVDMRYFNRKS